MGSLLAWIVCSIWLPGSASAQSLEHILASEHPRKLYQAADRDGNAARGAILFHGPLLGCGTCHSVSDVGPDLLGPNLAQPIAADLSPPELGKLLVESILDPSKRVAPEFQAVRVLTAAGQVYTGLELSSASTPRELVLRKADTLQDVRIPRADIEDQQTSLQSLMPDGLLQPLANVNEFYDLLKYLIEIQRGGARRARELQPTSAQLAIKLPEYESRIDHSGMIRDWDEESYERGRKVYTGLCANCHGSLAAPGSLATALRFGEGQFKHGADPYSMYQTLTRGAGLMLPQTWMVPRQKYDVIHYVREQFLRTHNPSQFFPLTEEYLASLPEGAERGPEPSPLEPWSQADYGPRLINTYEVGVGGRNIAQKGIALQLDDFPGGVAHGNAWVVFDHDTMRVAGVWTSNDFIDWQGIHFNGQHGVHPHAVGDILLQNPDGPGWAHPETGSLADEARVLGRDGKRYGPLPRDWSDYQGIYQVGRNSVIAYSVGDFSVREGFNWLESDATAELPSAGLFVRQAEISSRRPDLKSTETSEIGTASEERTKNAPPTSLQDLDGSLEMVVATLSDVEGAWTIADDGRAIAGDEFDQGDRRDWTRFDGRHYFEVTNIDRLDMFRRSFTIRAVIQAAGDGTIFSRAPRSGPWEPGGQTFFIQDGHLCYDIGWVGVMRSSERIAEGMRQVVALSWNAETGKASLWADGELVGQERLRPQVLLEDAVIRVGKTSSDFPSPSTLRSGQIASIGFYSRELQPSELSLVETDPSRIADARAVWLPEQTSASKELRDATGGGHDARWFTGSSTNSGRLVCGWRAEQSGFSWRIRGRQLLLRIPVGEEDSRLVVWSTRVRDQQELAMTEEWASSRRPPVELRPLETAPGQPIFPEEVVTEVKLGTDQGGFAVDELTIPKNNPWQARVRTSGLDFFDDGDRLAVCTWDGDVWIVSGLAGLDEPGTKRQLVWKRVAFGLFQPLGLKIIDGAIYLTCRDQLVKLEDRNGDGEVDFYRCVNNDHQVTEHFHEFAMGLQTDARGNFYYAKSARHALTAVVPHHGTLLRVSPDGSHTEIIARGFRAANGVCLNPDGTFIVTDQEGHWNPKNRINWVREGGFYGNMYGYHDVTDSSDQAMEQPLCWITNQFDRSPAELLWVESPAWGPFEGSLLNLSYGYGRIYVVPHEQINGQVQGGMCRLPIADLPTGIMRGRFSPFDGQLYACGLSAWATNQTQAEGGLYRIRYTGEPAAMPLNLRVTRSGLRIGFSEPLGEATSLSPDDYAIEVWALKRTQNYGSDHYNQHGLKISGVKISPDRQSLTLFVPDLEPTWCMEIRMSVATADGRRVNRIIHNTVHHLR